MKVINFFKNSDRLFALMMIIIAMVMYALIGGMDEPYSPGAMSASTYPRVVLASIIFVSTLLIIRPANTSKTQNAKSCRGIVVIIIMIAYISLLETIGFFILTPVVLFIIPMLAGLRRYPLMLISVILVTAGLYGVFVEVLNIPLPQGLLGE